MTESNNKYIHDVRPKVNAHSIRMDDELYLLNEIVRIYHSNEFVSPSNADILRVLLKQHVAYLREKDSSKVRDIEMAIKLVSNQLDKDK